MRVFEVDVESDLPLFKTIKQKNSDKNIVQY